MRRGNLHCKNCSVINTPNLLHARTNMVEGVSMEQIWCVYHTIVFTVIVPSATSLRYHYTEGIPNFYHNPYVIPQRRLAVVQLGGQGGASVSGSVQSDYGITFALAESGTSNQNHYPNSAIQCFKSPALSLHVFGFDV